MFGPIVHLQEARRVDRRRAALADERQGLLRELQAPVDRRLREDVDDLVGVQAEAGVGDLFPEPGPLGPLQAGRAFREGERDVIDPVFRDLVPGPERQLERLDQVIPAAVWDELGWSASDPS